MLIFRLLSLWMLWQWDHLSMILEGCRVTTDLVKSTGAYLGGHVRVHFGLACVKDTNTALLYIETASSLHFNWRVLSLVLWTCIGIWRLDKTSGPLVHVWLSHDIVWEPTFLQWDGCHVPKWRGILILVVLVAWGKHCSLATWLPFDGHILHWLVKERHAMSLSSSHVLPILWCECGVSTYVVEHILPSIVWSLWPIRCLGYIIEDTVNLIDSGW